MQALLNKISKIIFIIAIALFGFAFYLLKQGEPHEGVAFITAPGIFLLLISAIIFLIAFFIGRKKSN